MSFLLSRRPFALARLARHLSRNKSGVAAVEFALILPVMLLLYLGSAEITQALMASRKATLVARTLSDLTAQQTTQVPVVDADLTNIFAAATDIMAPFSATPLQMTITSVEFVADASSSTGYDAKPQWTSVQNGGVPRPCAILTPVSDSTTPTSTNLPTGVYAQGALVVADVVYTYTPSFGSSLTNISRLFSSQPVAGSLTYKHTTYMRPRQWTGTPSYITYTPGTLATVCAPY